MTEKNTLVPDNSQDVVISFGAFAMYLYKEDMEVALAEALRYLHQLLAYFYLSNNHVGHNKRVGSK